MKEECVHLPGLCSERKEFSGRPCLVTVCQELQIDQPGALSGRGAMKSGLVGMRVVWRSIRASAKMNFVMIMDFCFQSLMSGYQ